MTNIREHVELEDFDREYGIRDLLPVSILDELLTEMQKVKPIPFLMLMPNGTPYYSKGSLPGNDIDYLRKVLARHRIDDLKIIKTANGKVSIFPVIHELETIGYLALGYEKKEEQSSYPIIPLGNFILKAFMQLIRQNHKNKMTAGLHGQVVEESYARLKKKAALLEESEKKYRILAENLEVEVEKKTNEIKQAQTQLMQQDKMASIGQLAAGVAHEINNPMGFINSNLITLESYVKEIKSLILQYRTLILNLKDNMATQEGINCVLEKIDRINAFEKESDIEFILEDIPELLSESKDGAERIKKIVIDLKDFAHPGIEKPEYVDINHNLDSTLNIVNHEIKYKATVTKEYGKLPRVRCIHQQINQVFMNILVNAAQAIKKQGEINIKTRHVDGFVEIAISDTGSGIQEENLNKIFDPFFTTKEVGAGTGLGLNLVYNIVKNHNGTIDVESKVGEGTKFNIRIPAE